MKLAWVWSSISLSVTPQVGQVKSNSLKRVEQIGQSTYLIFISAFFGSSSFLRNDEFLKSRTIEFARASFLYKPSKDFWTFPSFVRSKTYFKKASKFVSSMSASARCLRTASSKFLSKGYSPPNKLFMIFTKTDSLTDCSVSDLQSELVSSVLCLSVFSLLVVSSVRLSRTGLFLLLLGMGFLFSV